MIVIHQVFIHVMLYKAVSNSPGTYPNIYKNNTWYPTLKDYVFDAFKFADKARKDKNLNVKLFYNDYGIHYQNSKSNAIYTMIQNMQKENIAIDGLGIQSHINLNDYPLDYDKLVSNMKRFSDDLGIEIHITELDDACNDCNGDFTPSDETKQAEMYQTLLKACIAVKNCKSYETWGWTDKYTWKGKHGCYSFFSYTQSLIWG